ncbi:glycosyltransferase [Ochrovirga pacifica]|uniref:glycosyltransferase n=1 Tax=Ochrovirga pacifica TaxID=1042376 RepID=UPI000255779E|nr:glycosyltransferase [Ochrovirga pacifica]
MQKKILFFYPDNPNLINQGNNARAHFLLAYFKARNFKVHLLGEKRHDYSTKDHKELFQKGLINKGGFITRNKNKGLRYMINESIPKKIKSTVNRELNRVRSGQQNQFNAFLQDEPYDYILISYAYWLPLIENNPLINKAKILVDTHDFLTSQLQHKKKFDLGKGFAKEMRLLALSDVIWAISDEENYLFSQFTNTKVITIPHGAKKQIVGKKEIAYDLFYVASNNPHNLASAQWFFEKVYPLLDPNLRIAVVGRVNQVIEKKSNITKIDFTEDLSVYYQKSKIALCPMLSGTGLKIKVVEALSYGIPVVGNVRAVDGLPNKINNGCWVATSVTSFANAIEQLLLQPHLYTKYSADAIQLFDSYFSEERVFEKLDEQFDLQ